MYSNIQYREKERRDTDIRQRVSEWLAMGGTYVSIGQPWLMACKTSSVTWQLSFTVNDCNECSSASTISPTLDANTHIQLTVCLSVCPSVRPSVSPVHATDYKITCSNVSVCACTRVFAFLGPNISKMAGNTNSDWIGWIVQCFTSLPTQYRLYARRFLQVKRPNQQYQRTNGTQKTHK